MSDVQLRKAAIRLACVHPDDRSWVLSQLSSDERQRLTALIDEAAALGLATDAAVVDAVLSESSMLSGDDDLNGSVVSERIARLGDAFWVALVLQRHGVKVRDELLTQIDSAAIRSWSERLDTESLPVALIDELYVISDAESSERA